MTDLLAIKRLTASDLTFFESLFRTIGAGNQKSINLNADVLTGQLYPGLSAIAEAADPPNEVGLALTIHGPAAAPPYALRRKIVKGTAYKNWRLNGEFVYDPPDQPGRFDMLRPGDIAVFAFRGSPAPTAVTMVLLAAASPADAAMQRNLLGLVPGVRSMARVTPERIEATLRAAGADANHPLGSIAASPEDDAALEDVAQGGAKGAGRLGTTRKARPVSPAELARAKQAAERIGLEGEAFVDLHLTRQERAEGMGRHEWVSQINAISPYDFFVSLNGGVSDLQKVDVKSTRGRFDADFHMSLAELREAADSPGPYRIYRVYELTPEGGTLRISGEVRGLAQRLLAAHNAAVFDGICADSFSIPPGATDLTWGPPTKLLPGADDEGAEE
jgi:hypothetical protein